MIAKFAHIAQALLLASPVALAQINFSDCTKQCIDQSTDDSCSLSDLKCICRQSNGRFLPDLVACWKAECNSDLNINDLLDPMQVGCRLIGTPISQSALDNARNMNDPVSQVTTTVLVTPTLTTVTSVGPSQTIVQVYPITEPSDNEDEEGQGTVTRYPPGTTLTRTQSSGSAATLVPVIVVSVDDDGNTQTATSTQTITRSESAQETGSMTTAGEEDVETTSTITEGASTATEETTATATDRSGIADASSSADATTTTTSGVSTSTAEATQTVDRNDGPLGLQPQGHATRGNPAAGLGLTIAIFVAGLFY